jgi:hypothetical protein
MKGEAASEKGFAGSHILVSNDGFVGHVLQELFRDRDQLLQTHRGSLHCQSALVLAIPTCIPYRRSNRPDRSRQRRQQ